MACWIWRKKADRRKSVSRELTTEGLSGKAPEGRERDGDVRPRPSCAIRTTHFRDPMICSAAVRDARCEMRDTDAAGNAAATRRTRCQHAWYTSRSRRIPTSHSGPNGSRVSCVASTLRLYEVVPSPSPGGCLDRVSWVV